MVPKHCIHSAMASPALFIHHLSHRISAKHAIIPERLISHGGAYGEFVHRIILYLSKSSFTKEKARSIWHSNYEKILKLGDTMTLNWLNLGLQTSRLANLKSKAKLALKVGTIVSLPEGKVSSKRTIQAMIMKKWEEEWTQHPKSEHTKLFIKRPEEARSLSRRNIPYEITQIITGHSCLNSFQYKIGNSQSKMCIECNLEETVLHFLFICRRFDDIRSLLKQAAREEGLPFPFALQEIISNKKNYQAITNYVRLTRRLVTPRQ